MERRLATSAALVAALVTPVSLLSAQQRRNPCAVDATQWQFDITPYIWASGLRGEVGVRERSAHVDVSFGKVLERLDGAFMLPAEVRKGRIGFGGEILWLKVSDDRAHSGRIFTGASAEASTFMAELGPRIRVATTRKVAVDALFGARVWSLISDLTLNLASGPAITSSVTHTWIDVFGGMRGFYNMTDRWLLQLRGDFGGFQSKLTWQALGLVGYTASDRVTLRAGYRYLDVDYHDRDDQFLYDVATGGPVLGVTLRF